MTPEEAIKTIRVAIAEVEWDYPLDYAIAFETAIEALEKQISGKHFQNECECIENLKIENQSLRSAANSYKIHYDEARAEAVKEFAYRLKERQQTFIGDEYTYKFIYLIEIDNLVKEYEKGR